MFMEIESNQDFDAFVAEVGVIYREYFSVKWNLTTFFDYFSRVPSFQQVFT